jgi:hypothetical protein
MMPEYSGQKKPMRHQPMVLCTKSPFVFVGPQHCGFLVLPKNQKYSRPRFKKALFFVESASGFEHFRIYTLQPKTNTVTLKNHSRFAADLSGWKLVSQKGEYVFEDIELSAGETISVSLPMKRVFSRIKLIAPDGNTKQIAELPIMLSGEMWKCETRRSESCGIISKTQD